MPEQDYNFSSVEQGPRGLALALAGSIVPEKNDGVFSGITEGVYGLVREHPRVSAFIATLGIVGLASAAETAIADAHSPVNSHNTASKSAKPFEVKSEASVSRVVPCEDSVESDCSYVPPEEPETPPKPENPDNGNNGDKGKGRDDNLLPLPERKTVRYYATQLLNEDRKGNKGRVNLSKSAKHDISLARQGRCAPIDMIPGACVKIKKTLLETLYKASLRMRYMVSYITGADHVTCSDHYQGRGADLMRFKGQAPHNRKLLHVFSGVLKRLPGHKTAQLLGPGDAGHSGYAAHWHIGITGENNICE